MQIQCQILSLMFFEYNTNITINLEIQLLYDFYEILFFSESSNLDFRMYQSSKDMSPDKDRALLDAIKQNNLDEVISLIENGVNINPETKDWTISPLQVAIYLGHEQIAKTLILKGAKTNMQDSDGIYPIHSAVCKN